MKNNSDCDSTVFLFAQLASQPGKSYKPHLHPRSKLLRTDVHMKTKCLRQTCKTDLDSLHALQYTVLRYGIPLLSIIYRHPLLQLYVYSTAPYSHRTLDAWPRPRNQRNCTGLQQVSSRFRTS